MNEILTLIVLGIVQGLTEFLPVSSSGHLEIAKYFLGDSSSAIDSLQVTVLLHLATALSTCLVFKKEISNIIRGIFKKSGVEERSFALKILLSMIPAAIIGVLFDDIIDSMFSGKLVFVSAMLLITGIILLIANSKKDAAGPLTYGKAFLIGIAQAIAITPGISRSGSTIATALILNVSKFDAARFSFLMVIPLIFGKICKDLLTGDFGNINFSTESMIAGFIAAFITGFLACKWMIGIVSKVRLVYFAIYCISIGISMIVYFNLIKG